MIPTHQRPTPETDAFIVDQDKECVTLKQALEKIANLEERENGRVYRLMEGGCQRIAKSSLLTPPPPVVPMADLQPLLSTIAAYVEFNGGCGHHPEDCPRKAANGWHAASVAPML